MAVGLANGNHKEKRMKFIINWAIGLFRKPEVEITFEPEVKAWPFPASVEKKKPKVAKATTRKAKKPAEVPAKKAVKKTAKKAK